MLRLGLREAAVILAQGSPEMAVFAAWAVQGRRGGRALAIAREALERAAAITDGALRRAVEDGILAVLHPTVVAKVKRGPMIDVNQLPKNPAVEQWKAELRAEGEARGEARLLLRVLRRRGFSVSPEVETQVLGTTDTGRIEQWTDRALGAVALDEVFAEG